MGTNQSENIENPMKKTYHWRFMTFQRIVGKYAAQYDMQDNLNIKKYKIISSDGNFYYLEKIGYIDKTILMSEFTLCD